VLRLVLRDGMQTALVGTLVGCLGAYWVGRAMAGLVPGVTGLDALTFAPVALLLIATAALACYVPARRAAAVDPLAALRDE
jgi:putative ABC transport system permease protein